MTLPMFILGCLAEKGNFSLTKIDILAKPAKKLDKRPYFS